MSNQLVIFPEANAERHHKALESSIRPVLMQGNLLQARTEASDLWAETQGHFSISDGLTEREKRRSERERERAGLPCVKLLYVFIWPWCRPHSTRFLKRLIFWTSESPWKQWKKLSKTFVWKFEEWDCNFSFVFDSNTVYIRIEFWLIISKVATLHH